MKKLHSQLNDIELKVKQAEHDYNYQPELTKKLDNQVTDFTEKTILEIALWKTNRYPVVTDDVLREIAALRKDFTEVKAKELLRKLLDLKGFDLPMASTVLRFACPDHLQIIDQRVYRFIMPDEDYLKIPHNKDAKVALYFKYLQHLKEACTKVGIPFNKADRIFYQLDKTENKQIPIKY